MWVCLWRDLLMIMTLVQLFLYSSFYQDSLYRVIFLNSSFRMQVFFLAVIVHVLHAYRNIEFTRESMSFNLYFIPMSLSFYIIFTLLHAWLACAAFDKISFLDPLSFMIDLKYLKLFTVSIISPWITIFG